MGFRQKIEEKIQKKDDEIREFETRIKEGKAYIQAMQETLKLLPRDDMNANSGEAQLKKNSMIYKTLAVLKKANRPMHVTEILKALGKPDEKKHRVSLSGSLGWYVRKNELFTRPQPNTFGLLNAVGSNIEDQLPDDFGSMDEGDKADDEDEYYPDPMS